MIASSATAGQPAQAEHAGQLALVHLRALGQPRLLRVLGDDAVEGLDVLQRPAHQHRVGHAPAVVGEHPHPGRRVGHRAELGQPLPGQPDGDRADRPHVAVARLPAEPPDLLDHAGGVGDRVGVGHRVHGGEAAERRRRVPVSTVSASSRPGSRRWVCRSTRPGSATRPSASTTSAPRPGQRRPAAPISAIRPVGQEQVGRVAARAARALDQDVACSRGVIAFAGVGRVPMAGSRPPSSR